jgi:pimeloyl-ACP methyl ester carboxylesterase
MIMAAAVSVASAVATHSIRSSLSSRVQITDIVLTCCDGLKLAAQKYIPKIIEGNGSGSSVLTNDSIVSSSSTTTSQRRRHRILCLHGWLDNCRSYAAFAPALVDRLSFFRTQSSEQNESSIVVRDKNVDVELIALDFPGHGQSDHKHDVPLILAEYACYVAEVLQTLEWTAHNDDKTGTDNNNQNDQETTITTTTLIGHSMGAAVACFYAAAFPENIHTLALLEGAGPLARPAPMRAQHVRHHILKRLNNNNKNQQKSSSPRIYPDLETAVRVRCHNVRNFPGNQTLSESAAREMVVRGTVRDAGGGWKFRHDPRLQWPSLQYETPEQVDALYTTLSATNTGLFLAHQGWPFDIVRNQHSLELLQPNVFETLPGSHHFHADPDTYERVVERVAAFLTSASTSANNTTQTPIQSSI